MEDVTGVIVGAQRIEKLSDADPERAVITAHFETNYTELYRTLGGVTPGPPLSFYVQERWSLSRKWSARSRDPDTVHSFHCPNCGAPLAIGQTGHCTHCDAKITGGAFDWVLSRIEQDESYGG